MDKKTVLIVEDDPAILSIVSRIANQHGFPVIQAKDGEEALGKVGEADIVLLDYLLPVKSGSDFLKTIRKEGNYIPVVVMSAGDHKDSVLEELGKYEVVDFVSKPFKSGELSSKLQKAAGLVDDMTFIARASDRLKGFIQRQAML